MGTPNVEPTFVLAANVNPVQIGTAATKSDGTGTIGTDTFVLATIGANDTWCEAIRFQVVATSANVATNALVGHAYLSTKNSGSTTGGTDTWSLGEVSIPSGTANGGSAFPPADLPIQWRLPTKIGGSAAYLLVSVTGTISANSKIQVTPAAQDY
jgi:hypothetical protein